jgi:hypothetical protein
MRVLAVDPGERVGWATATVYPEGIEAPDPDVGSRAIAELEVTGHGIAFLKDAAMQVYKAVVAEDRIDVVVYETFILTARGGKTMVGSDLQTAQLVGMIRLCGWLNPRVQLVPQRPGAMRSADKSMRSHPSGAIMQEIIAKLPKSHDESHDGSALRHLWTYFFERYV